MAKPLFTKAGWILLATGCLVAGFARGQGIRAWMTFRADDHAILRWESVPGGIYHIERSGGFTGAGDLAGWEYDFLGFPPTGAAGSESSIDLGERSAVTPVFYRLHGYEPPAGSLFYESFEGGGAGWTRFTSAGSAWSTAMWDPSCPMTIGPESPRSGLFAAGTDVFAAYAPDTTARFESPLIDLAGQTGATLTFWEWREIEEGFGDLGVLGVFDGAGNLVENIHLADGVSAGWTEVTVPLPAAAMGLQVRLRFTFLSDGANASDMAGWYIDDLCVMPAP
ncbi:MAG: hypothetical protein HKN82_17355 [Akkermansiaceae bacterium]|nr:hypothetical protein [Akkermansiaceae bacterium]